jgi:polyisoprenyl-phosphate glycosyltransferase
MSAQAPMLSLVVPVFNETEVLPKLHERITAVMEKAGIDYELLLVDDGSRDGSWELMNALRAKDPRISVLKLSRNFGHQIAISAGIDHARGEAVAVIDADLQDPPEVVVEMVQKWREGYDVIYGLRTSREGETAFKLATASAFYRVIRRMTGVDIPADTGDFRLMSRRAVEAFKRLPERDRFVRGMVAWMGFKQIGVPYARAARVAGETKYPLRKMIRLASDAIISFSNVPLRMATWAGVTISFGAFLYAGFTLYARFVLNETVQGWTSLMVAVLFLGGVQLLFLGVLGEYLGRIFTEAKNRPLYLIQEHRFGTSAEALTSFSSTAQTAPLDRPLA